MRSQIASSIGGMSDSLRQVTDLNLILGMAICKKVSGRDDMSDRFGQWLELIHFRSVEIYFLKSGCDKMSGSFRQVYYVYFKQ